jgi:hypothetical protein
MRAPAKSKLEKVLIGLTLPSLIGIIFGGVYFLCSRFDFLVTNFLLVPLVVILFLALFLVGSVASLIFFLLVLWKFKEIRLSIKSICGLINLTWVAYLGYNLTTLLSVVIPR